MSNPVFNRSTEFKARPAPTQAPPYAYGQPAMGQPGYQGAPADAAQLNAMYAQPAAGPLQTGRLTYDDVLIKSFGLFAVVLVSAVVGWLIAPTFPPIIWIGTIVALVFALVAIFKREPSPALTLAYGVFEGLAIGGLSRIFESMWSGIVLQAVLASFAVFGVTLALFASGKVRASSRMNKIWMIAMGGYILFSLINVILMVTGVQTSMFGLRSSVHIFGIPLGVILGIVVVFLAAYSFVTDFDNIKNAVTYGAPAKMAWKCALGLMITLVWLYLEMLRLLALLRNN
jgi:uncharacterized YccA/Bax inhibitor family protein